MASLVAFGLKPIGEHTEVEGFASDQVAHASTIVQVRKLGKPSSTPNVVEAAEESEQVHLLDLNIHPMSQVGGTQLLDVEGELDIENVIKIMQANDYKALPAPLRPEGPGAEVGYSMHVHRNQKETLRSSNGTYLNNLKS